MKIINFLAHHTSSQIDEDKIYFFLLFLPNRSISQISTRCTESEIFTVNSLYIEEKKRKESGKMRCADNHSV